MSGNKILADTNILLYFLQGEQKIIEILSGKEIYVSFITELELLAYNAKSTDTDNLMRSFLSNCTIIDINREIKDATIKLRKEFKHKLPDSIIAATSLYLKLPLLTADKKFGNFESLEVIIYETHH